MPVTIKVNGQFNSLVHKGSIGIARCTAPDVCKTPSPGGPVPIPYPVIVSMSNDLSGGTTTVKVDGGNMAAIKGSQFNRCMGDEPGTAGGIISQVNMKEAKWILFSFDVKLDGKNACRLGDKMTMNHANTFCLQGEVQAPAVLVDMDQVGKTKEEACAKVNKKRVPPRGHDKAAKDAGMLKEDYDAIRKSAGNNNAIVTFRDTNPNCMPHLRNGVPSKGMDVKQKTWKPECLPAGAQDLAGLVSDQMSMSGMHSNPQIHQPRLTGDYDMHDMMDARTGQRIPGESPRDMRIRERMNAAIPGDQPRIMHGAQAHYGDYLKKFPDQKPYAGLMQPDPPITAFDGSKRPAAVYRLETNEDILNFYKCKGTSIPPEWNLKDKKTGNAIKSL